MEHRRVGPFELMHRLGAGGMAETFAAVRRGPGGFEQWVCIKRILPDRDDDPAQIELFLDEARLLAQLRNANIVQVYDFGEADGSYYMALELIEGMDLSALLRALRKDGARLPVQIALYIVSELLRALHYAHTVVLDDAPLGIVHRDVSPSNVLLARQGEVKLTDFGIATYAGRTHKTRTGFVRGKVAYMSPEQVRAETLDARTDLFAAGIVAFELLAGEHPFDAATEIALLHNLHAGRRQRIEDLVPGLSTAVVALIDGLLEPDREARIANAAAALAAIPTIDNVFAAQAELKTLVSRYAPAKRTSRPSERPVVEPAIAESKVPSPEPPPAERVSQSDEVAMAPAVDRSTGYSRGRPRWQYALFGGGGLLALLIGGLWIARSQPGGRDPERAVPVVPAPPTSAVPQLPETPPPQRVETRAGTDLPLGDGEPDAEQTLRDTQDAAIAATADALDAGDPENATKDGATREDKRRSARTAGKGKEGDRAAGPRAPSRSGASVSSSEF